MVIVFSLTLDAKLRIVSLILRQTTESIVVATSPNDLVELAREHKPTGIFVFMPDRPASAIDIQMFLRELLPATRIRILPAVEETRELREGWQGVVCEALSQTQADKSTVESAK